MELQKPSDLFVLSDGDTVAKRNLFDLIQFSKVEKSAYWSGLGLRIGNTPQQGINWVGSPPGCHAVIIKTKPGSYKEDGWANDKRTSYRYSFKARKGKIDYTEKANAVLINQPRFNYPIFLFTESGNAWVFEGSFAVNEIQDNYVVLGGSASQKLEQGSSQEETIYQEGGRQYVTHLMVERSKGVVTVLKGKLPWICEICELDFSQRYCVEYIEAHHKIPISTYSSSHAVKSSDFALLCPNCHKAVHITMKMKGLEYPEISALLRTKGLNQN